MQKLHLSEEMRNKLAQIKKAVVPTALAAGLAFSGANVAAASQEKNGGNPQIGAAGIPRIVSGATDRDPAVKSGASQNVQRYADCGYSCSASCSGMCLGTCGGTCQNSCAGTCQMSNG